MPRITKGYRNEPKEPNKIWRLLKLARYFEDIASTDDLLQALYVSRNVTEQESYEEPLLNQAYAEVLRTEGIHTPSGRKVIVVRPGVPDVDCAYLEAFITDALKPDVTHRPIRAKRSSRRVLVLLGGIGEGKTTLLDYFFRVYARTKRRLSRLSRVNIDFDPYADTLPREFTPAYMAGLLRQALDELRPDLTKTSAKVLEVLNEPLARHAGLLQLIAELDSPGAARRTKAQLITRFHRNNSAWVAGTINYLVRHDHRQVVVTLDNVDRLHPKCQLKAINLIRQAIRQWDCCAIVCVREYTYGRLWDMTEWGFESPSLYHKRPPQFSLVLQRRFRRTVAVERDGRPEFLFGGKPLEIRQTQRFVYNVSRFLWVRRMEESLLRLANGNVRKMLNMTKAFLSFYALDLESLFTATFLKKPHEANLFRLIANFDNFIRAIIVGNHRFYSSGNPQTPEAMETFVLNLIGGPPDRPLLPYRLLTYIRKFEIVQKGPLVRKARCLGVTSAVVKNVLNSFLLAYLVESMQGVRISEVEDMIITRKGKYYFDELSVLAVYLENVANDAVWDKKVKPHEQTDSATQRATFLLEAASFVFRAEVEECARIGRRSLAKYKEFLADETYSERLCCSILLHLTGIRRRGTAVDRGIDREIKKLLVDICEAKKDGRVLCT